jgi:hypothetical protein
VEDSQLLKINFKALSKFKTNIRNIEEKEAKYKPQIPNGINISRFTLAFFNFGGLSYSSHVFKVHGGLVIAHQSFLC